jgi:hypothetical protein
VFERVVVVGVVFVVVVLVVVGPLTLIESKKILS